MRLSRVILLVILALGAFLRYSPIREKSLWLDEAKSAYLARLTSREILCSAREDRSLHPPLFFLALRSWSRLWGDSEAALRSLAATCGTLTVLGVYLLAGELMRLGRRVGPTPEGAPLLAAALVATSPMQVELSQFVRGYAMAAAFLVFGGWSLLRALGGGNPRTNWISAALLAAASCYTHHVAILTVFSQALFAALFLKFGPRGEHRASAALDAPDESNGFDGRGDRATRRWALAAGALFGALYLIPWFPTLLGQGERLRHSSIYHFPFTAREVGRQTLLALYATPDVGWYPLPEVTWAVVASLLGIGLFLTLKGRWAGWYLVLTGLLPALSLLAYSDFSVRGIYHARYLCFAQLSWLTGVAVVVGRLPGRPERVIAAAYVLGLSAYACYDSRASIGPSAEPGLRAAARLIADRRAADEPVIAQSPFVFFGIAHHARGQFRPRLCIDRMSSGPRNVPGVIQATDVVGVEDVVGLRKRGVWLIYSNAYAGQRIVELDVPDHWTLSGEWAFRQDRFMERSPVIVRHYRILGPAAP